MRLTQEIDYAFRIVAYLAKNEEKVAGAPLIAAELKVPERFTLRILRKLNLAGITQAKRGAHGGYLLKKDKEDISLYDIILAIDGPIIINRCLHVEEPFCSREEDRPISRCKFHHRLHNIQKDIVQQFEESKITDFIEQ